MASADLEKNVSIAEKALEKNPHADISTLLNLESGKETKSFAKEYIFSVIFAPLGLYYAFKLYMDGFTKQAVVCLILTIVVIAIYIYLGNMLFSSFSLPTNSLQNLYPSY